MADPFYLSITGLKVRHFWHLPAFWHHATRSMAQARKADGCLGVSARKIAGIHHTRSLWRSREAMLAFLRTGAHLEAMKAFHGIADGKTLGYLASEVPDWDHLHRLWHENGRAV